MSYSCTVLIPIRFLEEHVFLKRNLIQIDKFKHPEVELEVLVADQTQSHAVNNVLADLSLDYVKAFTCEPIDAGWPISVGAERASCDYYMTIDVDCAPIHRAWAYLPIKLIDKYNLNCVGTETGLHLAEAYKAFGNFFHINNYYRTYRTVDARKLAEDVGFMRYENRYKANFTPKVNTNWSISCDNGVVAQWHSDQINMGPKVSLALDNINGLTNKMGVWGMTIDSLVYHFVFSSSKEWINNKFDVLGHEYMYWYSRINNEGFTDDIFNELISKLIPHNQPLYHRDIFENGQVRKLTPQDEIFLDIEKIKNE